MEKPHEDILDTMISQCLYGAIVEGEFVFIGPDHPMYEEVKAGYDQGQGLWRLD